MQMKNRIILMSILSIFLFVGIMNVYAISTGSTEGIIDTNSNIVTDTATLSVTGVEANDFFKAYKILDTFYNSTTNVITYEFTSDFKNFLSSNYGDEYQDITVDDYYNYTSGDITSGSTLSATDIDKLASAYAGYINANNITGNEMTVSANVASANLAAGSYLVLPTSTIKVYAVMVGNLYFTASGDEWQISNEEIVAKVSEAGITKSVGESGYNSGSYSIGDDVPFILVGTVPVYPTNATNRVYKITDTLSEGLSFNDISSIKIQDGGETLTTSSTGKVTNSDNEEVANISISGQTMTITFNTTNINSNTVTVQYTAKLNEEAGIGVDGANNNTATLTYSNDPYGDSSYTTDGISVDIYTYGLEIYKYDENNEATALNGAEFTIYKDSDLRDAIATITTNGDGIATYGGLASGTYYVKETKAPTGYRLSNTINVIKIGPIEDSLDEAEESGYYRLEVADVELGLLPVTGGIGTIAITIAGLVIIGIAVCLFLVYRNKRRKYS